jgi:hypothetical protein
VLGEKVWAVVLVPIHTLPGVPAPATPSLLNVVFVPPINTRFTSVDAAPIVPDAQMDA